MSDNVWYWEVQTTKGDFYIAVIGRWSQDDAANFLWDAFREVLHAPIVGLVQRKRISGIAPNAGTVYEKENGDVGFMGGRKFFELVGKGALYDAEMAALDKQMGRKA